PGTKAKIARSEIELLVKQRVIRDMHLPVQPELGAIGVNNRRRVVIDAGSSLFEDRRDHYHLVLPGQLLKCIGRGTRDRLSQFEEIMILGLAKILRAKQLLSADDLGALPGGPLSGCQGLFEVGGRIGRAGGLDQTNPNSRASRIKRHAESLRYEPGQS